MPPVLGGPRPPALGRGLEGHWRANLGKLKLLKIEQGFPCSHLHLKLLPPFFRSQISPTDLPHEETELAERHLALQGSRWIKTCEPLPWVCALPRSSPPRPPERGLRASRPPRGLVSQTRLIRTRYVRGHEAPGLRIPFLQRPTWTGLGHIAPERTQLLRGKTIRTVICKHTCDFGATEGAGWKPSRLVRCSEEERVAKRLSDFLISNKRRQDGSLRCE